MGLDISAFSKGVHLGPAEQFSEEQREELYESGDATRVSPANGFEERLDGRPEGFYRVPIGTLNARALRDSGLSAQDIDRSKNMFALGLLFWMYSRPMDTTVKYIDDRFGRRWIMTTGFALAVLSYWPVFTWMGEVKDNPVLLCLLVWYMVILVTRPARISKTRATGAPTSRPDVVPRPPRSQSA